MFLMNLIAQVPKKPFGNGFELPANAIFNPGMMQCGTSAFASIDGIISLILGFITVIAGLGFLLYFIFGGLEWTLAGGDTGKVDSAKKQMTNGAIGLIIIIISYGIISVIGSVLGLEILDPGQSIQRLNPNCNGTNGGGGGSGSGGSSSVPNIN